MRWTLFSLPLLVLGCWGQGEEPPGQAIGTFNAVGFMVEQSCGAAIPAPDPLDLDFELRSEFNGRAYWRLLGGAMFAGVEKDGEYRFQVSQSFMVVEPDRFRGFVGCSVTQRDVFTFVVETVELGTETDGGVDDGGVEDGALKMLAPTKSRKPTLAPNRSCSPSPARRPPILPRWPAQTAHPRSPPSVARSYHSPVAWSTSSPARASALRSTTTSSEREPIAARGSIFAGAKT